MKKRILTVGGLLLYLYFAKAQNASDSSTKISKTQVDIVYNHYMQDGNNSAITGGIGTEKLNVYGPSLTIKRFWNNKALKVNLGSDIISSASTDNIDFVVSSASSVDARTYINGTYEYTSTKKELNVYGGLGLSIESDYFSIGSKFGFVKEDSKNLTQYSAEFQLFNDDLRWGRLDGGSFKPQKLIYPYELRYKDWYDEYRRQSFNLKLGFTKAINKRVMAGIFPLLSYQKGLLATPFHRIYFSDGSKGVEQLPNNRYKASVELRWNQFVRRNLILKNTLNSYMDSWGIVAASAENETAIKLNAIWTLLPSARFYTQKGSMYFAPYTQHISTDQFYTSDFDLSSFQTYSVGIGFKYAPYAKISQKKYLKTFILRYNFMYRTNGLNAHIVSLVIQIE